MNTRLFYTVRDSFKIQAQNSTHQNRLEGP